MKNILMIFISAMIFGFSMFHTTTAIAFTKNAPTGNGLSDQQRYTWYDGDKQRSIWLNPNLLAEFNPKDESRSQLKSLFSATDISKKPSKSIRWWKLDGAVSSKQALKNLKSTKSTGHFSPVLHDSASSSASKRLLPGNVIVVLDPAWDQATAKAWFEAQNVVVIEALGFTENAFLIKTEAGLDALNTANRLYETGEVKLASPNWWKEIEHR